MGGDSQSPATVIPNTLMQGMWNSGSFGNFGQSKVTPETFGVFHTIIGAQPRHGTINGTMVSELSEPVVVYH